MDSPYGDEGAALALDDVSSIVEDHVSFPVEDVSLPKGATMFLPDTETVFGEDVQEGDYLVAGAVPAYGQLHPRAYRNNYLAITRVDRLTDNRQKGDAGDMPDAYGPSVFMSGFDGYVSVDEDTPIYLMDGFQYVVIRLKDES